jgi:uncharacterized alkaline shock family protein YloU
LEINKDENININTEDVGEIQIADDVVSAIAAIAANEVAGVHSMASGLAGGIAEMLGKKNLSKGIKVEINDNTAVIDIYIIIEYGCKISDVAQNIQEKVKNSIETMTGIEVSMVNIHVQGVNLGEEPKTEV